MDTITCMLLDAVAIAWVAAVVYFWREDRRLKRLQSEPAGRELPGRPREGI